MKSFELMMVRGEALEIKSREKRGDVAFEAVRGAFVGPGGFELLGLVGLVEAGYGCFVV
jgi:hypothetical protein